MREAMPVERHADVDVFVFLHVDHRVWTTDEDHGPRGL